jgi:hypothetical protein
MRSNEILLAVTGDPIYADRCEDIAFNSLPASTTPDLKALHYLTAPNMIQLDKEDKSPLLQNPGTMLSYDPREYRCCQHNVSQGWPYFAEHLWMATQNNGLAAVLYAESEVNAKVGDGTMIRITEKTDYPFGERVEFRISLPKPVRFPLLMRVPGWCQEARILINSEPVNIRPRPRTYIEVDQVWDDGDSVRLELPARIRLTTWNRNKNSVSVHRGPLTYSLRISETWVRYGGSDEWPAFEVYPDSAWNYGLALDPEKDDHLLRVRKSRKVPSQPFVASDAPIRIEATGRRIDQWRQEANGLIGVLPESPVESRERLEELTLIPMGCARLRISAFPTVASF